MSTSRFFSKEDMRGARRWEPGTIGTGSMPPADETANEITISEAKRRAKEDGYRAGLASGQAAAEAAGAQLASIIAAARGGLNTQEQEVAECLLELALDVARQIIRADLHVRREHVLPAIREAMDCITQSTPNPQLFLHPNDVDLVRSRIGDEILADGWRIVEDHRIEPGGCRINSPSCEVDATMSTRWKRVVASLGYEVSWIESADPA